MKKLSSYIILTALLSSLHAKAQQELCICCGDSCDVFETRHVGALSFAAGYLTIEHMRAYAVQRIDSITFARPRLAATELGWWGTLDEGSSRYELRYDDATLGFTYHVSYHFEAHEGCCTSATCDIQFANMGQRQTFVQTYLERPATDATNDPYIYVKETLTGPRKFELWTMTGPILPVEAITSYDITAAHDNCTVDVPLDDLLAGRTMADVRLVVEGWLYNPLVKADNPNYKPNE